MVNMKRLNGYTEQEVLTIIEKVVTVLAPNFTFGHYDVSDIKQEGTIMALEAIDKDKYDSSRPLENFLYTHVKNRLINLKRNKFARHEPPCSSCPFFDPDNKLSLCKNQCSAYEDKMECSRWEIYITRNIAKRNLQEPMDIGDVDDEYEDNMKYQADPINTVVDSEFFKKIDGRLDPSLRSDFMKLMAGVTIPKKKREKVRQAIEEILYGED